jgi:hypothetical protein
MRMDEHSMMKQHRRVKIGFCNNREIILFNGKKEIILKCQNDDKMFYSFTDLIFAGRGMS